MATLAFQAVGSVVGSTLLPNGIGLLGATIAGSTIGAQVGALAGAYVDQALFGTGGQTRTFEGPRLEDLRVTTSSEGAPIPRIYGAARVGGQVIWATEFEEVRTSRKSGGQSKGGGLSGGGGSSTTQVSYSYFANFAVALTEGPITGLGRVWADGDEWNLADIAHRVHFGSENQAPDALISAREQGDVPAFRGTAYIVFERLPLADFGNRLPQLSSEVFRAVDDLGKKIKGTVIIPGSGEFVYATTPVQRREFLGEMVPENVHTREAETNWATSMNQMQRTLPNVASSSLVVCWFGNDLRAGQCQVTPRVERREKVTRPVAWSAAGLGRSAAAAVSYIDGRPAYGGTPSDASVVQAIEDLTARGIKAVLTPFVLMDIAQANALPDPYTGQSGQPVYPWRGRVTVDPAPGQVGSPDKTAIAGAQIASFVGNAAVSDFTISGKTVNYAGPADWGYRRFILHYAHLAKAAGGVDAFLIGTELRGLTWVRDATASYPFVRALMQLAADVKAVLGPSTKVTYAADWSEYFGHQPQDGTGDVTFHLDPLWASANIDAVGIDLYWPLADWRDGEVHRDRAIARSIYDQAYLKSNIRGGEGFDWYYASDADREAQTRTPITDGTGKPWVFRTKDLTAWWENAHYDRPGGVESAASTPWQPRSKPIWLMEIGCPAVDKGANQPNVFFDPKSAESRLPYFAAARRDDFMQRAYIRALVEGFDPAHVDAVPGANPVSPVYGGLMVDLERIHVYAWDARAFPAFPNDSETWGDAPNWNFGHWLNGRMAYMSLDKAIEQIFHDYGFTDVDVTALDGVLPGFLIDRVMSLREAIQPIEMAFFLDTIESGNQIKLRKRASEQPVARLTAGELVETKPGAELLSITRGQETDLPASAKITYATAGGDYRRAVAESRRLAGFSERVATASLAMMLEGDHAQAIAETWLHEAWAARRRGTMVLPPSRLGIEPGDTLETDEAGFVLRHRITAIADQDARSLETTSFNKAIYEPLVTSGRRPPTPPQPVVGVADALFMDLPMIGDGAAETDGYVALHQAPWPGTLALYQSPGEDGFSLVETVPASAVVGELIDDLTWGPTGRIDHRTRVRVELASGGLLSVGELELLEGANAIAIQHDDESWEVAQFSKAELVGARTYELTGWLRGQLGSETWQMPDKVVSSAGRPFAVLDETLVRTRVGESGIGRRFNWRFGPASRDLGHASYAGVTHAFQGRGRVPLAPVHVRGARATNGDLEVRWVRRTRVGGDSWEQTEVALGEASEAYEVDIVANGIVRRTLASATPSVTYSVGEQAVDFGAVPGSVMCRVYQMSATVGRGAVREVTV